MPSPHEVDRLLGLALVRRANIRRIVLHILQDDIRARAPELGIDFRQAAGLATTFQRQTVSYDIVMLLAMILSIPSLLAALGPKGLILYIPIMFVLALPFELKTRRLILEYFGKDTYSAHNVSALASIGTLAQVRDRFSPDRNNLVVYARFNPFVGAGLLVNSWSFAIMLKPQRELLKSADIIHFNDTDLSRAIAK